MIVIISAASCTGKTLLTKRITDACGVKSIAMDSIKMNLYRTDENCGFTPTDSNLLIAEKIWPIVKHEITAAIDEGVDLIIEGAYFYPEYLKDISKEYLKDIYPVFICFTPRYIQSNYKSGIINYRHIAKKRNYLEDRPIEVFIRDHEILKERCDEMRIPVHYIESDYQREIDKIYNIITRKLNDVKMK